MKKIKSNPGTKVRFKREIDNVGFTEGRITHLKTRKIYINKNILTVLEMRLTS